MELLKKRCIINSSFANWRRNGWQRSNVRFVLFLAFAFAAHNVVWRLLKYGRTPNRLNAEAYKNGIMKRGLFTTAKILIIIISLTLEFHTLFIYLLSWSTIRFIWNLESVFRIHTNSCGATRAVRMVKRKIESDFDATVAVVAALLFSCQFGEIIIWHIYFIMES